MRLFTRKQEPAGWYPAKPTCHAGKPPAVLYFHPGMPAAVIYVTVAPVTDDAGQPRVQVTADWQIRRPPRYIAARPEWRLTHSELLSPPIYESPEEAARVAAVIVKRLLRGAPPSGIMIELDRRFVTLICNWDGRPFEMDAEAGQ